jgi:hypothetical protein
VILSDRNGVEFSLLDRIGARGRHLDRTPAIAGYVLSTAVPEVGVEHEDVPGIAGHDELIGVTVARLGEAAGNGRGATMGPGYDSGRAVLDAEFVEHPQCGDAIDIVDSTGWSVGVQTLSSGASARFATVDSHVELHEEL